MDRMPFLRDRRYIHETGKREEKGKDAGAGTGYYKKTDGHLKSAE